MLVAMWKTSIFSNLSAPTEIRDPTLSLDPASVRLDPTKRGLRDPTPRVCKTQLAWKNKRKLSLPPHMHLFDHHLELITSSILVIVNSKERQVNKVLEIQLKTSPSQMSSLQSSILVQVKAKHHQSPKQPKQKPPKPPNASTKNHLQV